MPVLSRDEERSSILGRHSLRDAERDESIVVAAHHEHGTAVGAYLVLFYRDRSERHLAACTAAIWDEALEGRALLRLRNLIEQNVAHIAPTRLHRPRSHDGERVLELTSKQGTCHQPDPARRARAH